MSENNFQSAAHEDELIFKNQTPEPCLPVAKAMAAWPDRFAGHGVQPETAVPSVMKRK